MTSRALDTTVFWPDCLCFHLSSVYLSWSSLPKPWVFTPSQSECSWRTSKTSPGSSRATALCRTLTLSITTATWLLSGSLLQTPFRASYKRPCWFGIPAHLCAFRWQAGSRARGMGQRFAPECKYQVQWAASRLGAARSRIGFCYMLSKVKS